MEVMMNRLLTSHFEAFLVEVRDLIDGFTNRLIAAAEDIQNDDAAAHSDTNIQNGKDENKKSSTADESNAENKT